MSKLAEKSFTVRVRGIDVFTAPTGGTVGVVRPVSLRPGGRFT